MAMENGALSASDVALMTKDNNNGWNDMSFMWIFALLILANGGGGLFGGNGATGASQYEILAGQQFATVNNKLNDIGNGVCDGFFNLNNTVRECCCNTQLLGKDIIANNDRNTADILSAMNNGFQRVIDNQNGIEMQHLRDAQMRDYIDKSLCGIVRYPTQMNYCSPCNPFCGTPNCCA